MNREALKQYLHNKPLVEAIRQKMAIDETRRKLRMSIQLLHEVGLSEVNEAIKAKLDEYVKAGKAYDALIEDVWGITWQHEEVIRKYLDYDDDELDRLPAEIK